MVQYLKSADCTCGKNHSVSIYDVAIGKGVISKIAQYVKMLGGHKAFLLADKNTFAAAGELVCNALACNDIPYSAYVFPQEHLEPNEEAVGSAIMHFDTSCDIVIGIGSGVINDISKILSNTTGKPFIIVATAPSMDGYASATSSMSMDGLKVSLNSRCADVIIGDTDVLKKAPDQMLKAGIGDMLAKYVSIAEWRIAHLITGEYYCPQVAELVRSCLKKCVANAEGLLKREDDAIEAVFEGLVIGGIAMAYAGVSRPASGVEHYFSHIWDMRGLEFNTKVDLHGVQCAIGTLLAVKLYEKIKQITPNYDIACRYVEDFSYEEWKKVLRDFLGDSAETMIAQEQKEGKYNKATHPDRFAKICENWGAILQILEEELPSYEQLEKLMDTIQLPKDSIAIDVDRDALQRTFKATKDIRDKYVLSRLAWDMGVIEDLCDAL